MNKIARDIFKAVHQGKWLAVEYRNQSGAVTSYWIGIKQIDTKRRMFVADGLNVASCQLRELRLFYASIQNTFLIDGSYYPLSQELISDIAEHSSRYAFIFQNTVNLKLLNYYSECSKLDCTPYRKDYQLIDKLDLNRIEDGGFRLSDEQFAAIVSGYHAEAKFKKESRLPRHLSLCMNVCSVHTTGGLYVLAYRKLLLDVQNRFLRPDDEITVCSDFTVNGVKTAIGQFLDGEDLLLLDDFAANAEKIKDAITRNRPEYGGVDDMPYVMAIARDSKINLETEYEAILDMYGRGEVTYPLKAFFGDLTAKPRRTKNYTLALYNDKVNMDQLLAIHNGVKYPVLYVQGPPGSGKTNTILNTVITAFFNQKTVLLTSYNNHPVDELCQKLADLKYAGGRIPFPVIRLGNAQKMQEAVLQIRKLREQAATMQVFDSSLEKKRFGEQQRAQALSDLLGRYEEKLDMTERREMIETLLSSSTNMPVIAGLQGRQLRQAEEKLRKLGSITEENLKPLIGQDRRELLQYLNFTSAKWIKRLDEPKYKELLDILYGDDLKECAANLSKYLSADKNFQQFLRVFPVVATTNLSAHKLGEPKPYFDMVIMDEASQCSTAVALVPIIRGKQLMLVGDPQQLSPVILLDEKSNAVLKARYDISDEYDYCRRSVYQTFLAADAVSDEVLLSYHYRCHPKIIEFNNRKYYNGKLTVRSSAKEPQPLVFIDCESASCGERNTNSSEAEEVLRYVQTHRDKSIGIITPFVNQKEKIQTLLDENGITDVDCGTVHAFQGDEKQEIIFSLALSERTGEKTYNWLKNNRELINVATSRAQEKLIIAGDAEQLHRLHHPGEEDDLFELCNYVRSNGTTSVSQRESRSRALGIKPYSTETETAFLENLNHALGAMLLTSTKYTVQREVAISHVFSDPIEVCDLFYTGRFDYVVYEKDGRKLFPVFAIELDGNEHTTDEQVIRRDRKKQQICQRHNFQLIRVPNSYARRYYYVKEILSSFFEHA